MVTGGAGFIGSAVIRRLVADGYGKIVNVDLLTYAGNLESLIEEAKYPGYEFEQADIRDSALIGELIMRYEPHAIMHLAAESHVDRSIDGPGIYSRRFAPITRKPAGELELRLVFITFQPTKCMVALDSKAFSPRIHLISPTPRTRLLRLQLTISFERGVRHSGSISYCRIARTIMAHTNIPRN